MNAMDYVFLVLALLVGGGLVYYVLLPAQPTIATTEKPALSFDIALAGSINQPLVGTLTGTHLVGKIIQYSDGEKIDTLSCLTDPCTFQLSLTYSTPGSRTLSARVDNSMRVTQTIQITSNQSVCIDGTLEGGCSAQSLSLRCTNAKLVQDCDACGCPGTQTCINHACTLPALTFNFTTFKGPTTAYTTSDTTFNVGVTPTVPFVVDGTFVLYLDEYSSAHAKLRETPHTIQLTNAQPTTEYPFTISQRLQGDTHYVSARWYPYGEKYDSSTLLAETPNPFPITVNADSTPPSAPGTLSYTLSENTAVLTWGPSPSNDVANYRIYEQTTSTGGFTTYHVLTTTSQLSYTISPAPLQDTAYVIRAMDAAGNEGPASNPVLVPGS